MAITLKTIPTPSYVIDEGKLKKNLEILSRVQDRTGCKILLAQKCFSGFAEYPLIGKHLAGCTASGLFEARLGKEEMGKENHIFSPAYKETEIDEIAEICDHVIFNSFSQLQKFAGTVAYYNGSESARIAPTGVGLRINPECSTQEHGIYDPCAPGSRLGVTRAAFDKATDTPEGKEIFDLVEGIHFHTLCEQNADALEKTLEAVEEKFGEILRLPQIRWINMGGGHHITRADYNLELLEKLIKHMMNTYNVEVYLEPGEAVALNAGYLVTEVMEIVENDIKTLILDASAACHMPDVLEMPYRPPLRDSGKAGKYAHTYRLSSCTCLAGDIIGDYSFEKEIEEGDRLVFEDMAIYSMVKNNTFNGMALPSIWALSENGECRLIKEFSYLDFKGRLS